MTSTALLSAYFATPAGFAQFGIAIRPLHQEYNQSNKLARQAVMLRRLVAGNVPPAYLVKAGENLLLPTFLAKQLQGKVNWIAVVETAQAAAYLRDIYAQQALIDSLPAAVIAYSPSDAVAYNHHADNE